MLDIWTGREGAILWYIAMEKWRLQFLDKDFDEDELTARVRSELVDLPPGPYRITEFGPMTQAQLRQHEETDRTLVDDIVAAMSPEELAQAKEHQEITFLLDDDNIFDEDNALDQG